MERSTTREDSDPKNMKSHLTQCNPVRDRSNTSKTYNDGHKNIIYDQYISSPKKRFFLPPREGNLFVTDSCFRGSQTIFTYFRVSGEREMLLLTDVLLFSPLFNMHYGRILSAVPRRRRATAQYILKFFMITAFQSP